MAGALTTKTILDGNGASVTMRVWDESGVGTGPFSFVTYISASSVNSNVANNGDGVAATANAAAPVVNYSYGFNGTTWDRLQVDASKNLKVVAAAATSGGLTETGIITTAAAIVGNVKASAGQLYKLEVTNNSVSWVYLKIYNTAGSPTAGVGTPQRRIGIPPSSALLTTSDIGGVYSTGIGYAIVGGSADADSSAVAAGILVNFHSK